jgi:prevent-host-death family protein
MKVGTKELKNRLSEYLAHVRRGETVHVTARGKVVAEIRPVTDQTMPDEEVLRQLAAEGAVTPGTGALRDIQPIRPRRPVRMSRFIIEDRR